MCRISNEELIERMANDDAVCVSGIKQRNALFDYMEENDIDPSDYRIEVNTIWLA